MKRIGLYEISVIVFFLLLPIIGMVTDVFILKVEINIFSLMFKWFVFSGVGLRLMSAGLKQAISPSFTAKEIFKVNEERSFAIVREIGFANISFGLIGILSFFYPVFRLAAAISGGLYFGLAGWLHFFNKNRSRNEVFAMLSDYFILIILLIINIFSY